jgi:hypothetical protein
MITCITCQEFAKYIELFDDAAKEIDGANPHGVVGEASSNTYTAEGVWTRGHSE